MKTLFIDSTNNKKTIVRLIIEGKIYSKEEIVEPRSPQKVLPLINLLLQEQKIAIKDITHITVAEGPGSFTGVRVGVAIGNACAFALGIPINGGKFSKGKSAVEPKY